MGFFSHCYLNYTRTALSEKCEKCFWFLLLYAGGVWGKADRRPPAMHRTRGEACG